MLRNFFEKQVFPERASFNLALAVFAFNVFVVCLFFLLAAIVGLPDPIQQISGRATLGEAKAMLMLTVLWGIGNSLLLLGFVDAIKPGKTGFRRPGHSPMARA